jgi:hypothetical protein
MLLATGLIDWNCWATRHPPISLTLILAVFATAQINFLLRSLSTPTHLPMTPQATAIASSQSSSCGSSGVAIDANGNVDRKVKTGIPQSYSDLIGNVAD